MKNSPRRMTQWTAFGWIACLIVYLTPTFAQQPLIATTEVGSAAMNSLENNSDPEAIVYFNDPRNEALFDRSEVKEDFWSLCRYFESQQMLTYCGVASSVAALNSLDVASPDVPQIYPHRMFTQENFFTDAVLQVRRPTDVEKEGSTLDQLAAMLSSFDVEVKMHRMNELTVEQMRKLIVNSLRSPNQRVIVDIDRAALNQEGGGHFSPLAAWDEKEDRFLMLDVARYKLPPGWVTANNLHQAMDVIDPASGKPRGFIVLTKKN